MRDHDFDCIRRIDRDYRTMSKPFRHKEVSDVADRFAQNVDRAIYSCTLPFLLAAEASRLKEEYEAESKQGKKPFSERAHARIVGDASEDKITWLCGKAIESGVIEDRDPQNLSLRARPRW